MTRPVGGVMMVLEQGWGSVCLVGMLAQTSPILAVLQVDGSSQNAQVSHAAWPDLHIQLGEACTWGGGSDIISGFFA
jgi:hypothetical protein